MGKKVQNSISGSTFGKRLIDIAMSKGESPENALNIFMDDCITRFDISNIKDGISYMDWVSSVLLPADEYTDIIIGWMKKVHYSLTNGGVFDFFGHAYEEMFLTSTKAKAHGQFFTPMEISRLLADLECCGLEFGENIVRVCDPCAGSGRLLLSAYSKLYRDKTAMKHHRFLFMAEDIDIVACKMTALNMMAHAAYGCVVCHDVLMMSPPQAVYIVNECNAPYFTPLFSIRTLTGEQASQWFFGGGPESLELRYKIDLSEE